MVDGDAIDGQAGLKETGSHLGGGKVDGARGRRSRAAQNRGVPCYVVSVGL